MRKPSAATNCTSLPIIPIQTPVLHRFGEMFRSDALGMVQIRDGAGDLQQALGFKLFSIFRDHRVGTRLRCLQERSGNSHGHFTAHFVQHGFLHVG
jgi:hypothetical protein